MRFDTGCRCPPPHTHDPAMELPMPKPDFRRTGNWERDIERTDPAAILVVEDSLTQRIFLRHMLIRLGYRVLEASDGAEAEVELALHRPDAILLDWELPGESGLDLLLRWQNHPEFKWTPVLMITANNKTERIGAALGAGAVDYLRKPPDTFELDARLRCALRIRSLQDELRFQATHDVLTGLYNRRALLGRLDIELEHAARTGHPLSLAILDIDHFKRINDVWGHAGGDLALRQFTAFLKTHLGDKAVVGRYGGEEFIVLLQVSSPESAHALLDEIRLDSHRHAWGEATIQFDVRFSGGLASSDRVSPLSADSLIRAADTALYTAKSQGRDRLALAP